MDKIANISVRDTSKVGFAQIAQSPTFSNIFAWNFQDMRKSAICTQNGGGFFIEASEKNLVAKFRQLHTQIFSKA